MHLEPLERGKTMWVCDDCERDYKAMAGKLFRLAEESAPSDAEELHARLMKELGKLDGYERSIHIIKEHDAKIRREAYLRCAEYNEDRYGEGSQFRKWANEPPSGGKAGGGGECGS
jgi:hypothetical protein